MKKLLLSVLFLILASNTYAQDRGFVLPKLVTNRIGAITASDSGIVIEDSTTFADDVIFQNLDTLHIGDANNTYMSLGITLGQPRMDFVASDGDAWDITINTDDWMLIENATTVLIEDANLYVGQSQVPMIMYGTNEDAHPTASDYDSTTVRFTFQDNLYPKWKFFDGEGDQGDFYWTSGFFFDANGSHYHFLGAASTIQMNYKLKMGADGNIYNTSVTNPYIDMNTSHSSLRTGSAGYNWQFLTTSGAAGVLQFGSGSTGETAQIDSLGCFTASDSGAIVLSDQVPITSVKGKMYLSPHADGVSPDTIWVCLDGTNYRGIEITW